MSDLPVVLKSKTFSIQEKHSESIDYEVDRFSSLASLTRTTARILLLKTRRSLKVLAQTLTHPDDGFYLSPNCLLLGRTQNQIVPFPTNNGCNMTSSKMF